MDAVRISRQPMTLDDVVTVAEGAPVALGDDAIDAIVASRQVVDEAIGRGEAIYGVTTGVGHARDERLPPDALRAMQPMLLEMHAGAMGPALPAPRVRAGLVVRLNGFARGGAGVSLGLARGVAALLNHGIHPVIPEAGSLGAGDLGQLAMVGRVLLGRGEVDVEGRRLAAGEALAAAGLAPLTLEPKDALAVMSSNALSVGHGALLVRRVARLLDLADVVAAASMEATHANPSILDPAASQVRASAGQQRTAERMRRALSGSSRTDAAAGLSVQDALSFRVVPQVHGACRDALAVAAAALTAELNAAADNPMVDVATGQVISNGNFHPMNVVLGVESLRVALAHVGQLAERRMGRVWDAAVTALGAGGPTGPPGGAPDGGGPPGGGQGGPPDGAPPLMAGLALRYPAAAAYTRLRQLAMPVSLDVPVLDLGVEDHAPNTAEVMRATGDAVAIVGELLVTELLVAMVPLGLGGGQDRLGAGTGPLVGLVGEEVRGMAGAQPQDVHARISDLVRHRHAEVAGDD
jgi:histidine ammonia-lyase